MYEKMTYDHIVNRMMKRMPDEIDRRVGSIAYIIAGPPAWDDAELYRALDQVHTLTALPTAPDEYLDDWGDTFGVERNAAVAACYEFFYEGERPPIGRRFFHNGTGMYFTVRETADGEDLYLEAEEAGIAANNIAAGDAAVPVTAAPGLKSASFGALIDPGVDTEPDNSYRRRIKEQLAGPAANGNRQHYKTWCESVDGVGRAKIVSLFAGKNTVMGVLFDADGKPAARGVVDKVQEYVDPITEGVTVEYNGQTVTVGDGAGDGAANIGAHFYAVAGGSAYITVEFTPTLNGTATLAMAQEQAARALTDYFRILTLTSLDRNGMTIRRHDIGSILMNVPAIADYEQLRLNGQRANVSVPLTDAPLLQEVIVHEAV